MSEGWRGGWQGGGGGQEVEGKGMQEEAVPARRLLLQLGWRRAALSVARSAADGGTRRSRRQAGKAGMQAGNKQASKLEALPCYSHVAEMGCEICSECGACS